MLAGNWSFNESSAVQQDLGRKDTWTELSSYITKSSSISNKPDNLCCTDIVTLKWTRHVNTWQILKNTHDVLDTFRTRHAFMIEVFVLHNWQHELILSNSLALLTVTPTFYGPNARHARDAHLFPTFYLPCFLPSLSLQSPAMTNYIFLFSSHVTAVANTKTVIWISQA